MFVPMKSLGLCTRQNKVGDYKLKHTPRHEAEATLRYRVRYLLGGVETIPPEFELLLNTVLGDQPSRLKLKALADLIWEFR